LASQNNDKNSDIAEEKSDASSYYDSEEDKNEKSTKGKPFCEECGSKLSEGAKFCVSCGHKTADDKFNDDKSDS
jgi:rRNA maturation endonuclease Nob1